MNDAKRPMATLEDGTMVEVYGLLVAPSVRGDYQKAGVADHPDEEDQWDESEWEGVPHIRVRHDITSSPAWNALSFSAQALYIDLRVRMDVDGNGAVECTPSSMRGVGWKSKTTIYLALAELEVLGFIAKTRQGHRGRADKACSLFRFTDMPCPGHPEKGVPACGATMDWLAIKTNAEADAALKAINEKRARPIKARA